MLILVEMIESKRLDSRVRENDDAARHTRESEYPDLKFKWWLGIRSILLRLTALLILLLTTSVIAKPLDQVRWQAKPGTVSLTFDDGPSPVYTPQVLKILRDHDIHATFFVMGPAAKKHPELLKQMVAEGHAVAIHTMTHPKLTRLSNQRLYEEVVGAKNIVNDIIGKPPVCLRPPFGMANQRVKDFTRLHNIITVPMGFNSFDYKNRGVARLTNWVVQNARSGQVFLLHDGYDHRAQTVAALPGIIAGIRRKGLGFSAICYP